MKISEQVSIDEWIVRNYDAILEYAKEHDVSIHDMGLSAKAFNALRINNSMLLSKFVLKTKAEIADICFDDRNAAEEISMYTREWLYLNRDKIAAFLGQNSVYGNEGIVPPTEDTLQQVAENDSVKRLVEFAKEHDRPIETLGLSVRVLNKLKRSHVNMLSELAALYPDGYAGFHSLGKKTADEINHFIEYISHNTDILPKIDTNPQSDIDSQGADTELDSKYTELAKQHDAPIEALNLSTRAYNILRRSGIDTLSKMVELYPDGYAGIRNMGAKTIDEIKRSVETYFADVGAQLQNTTVEESGMTAPDVFDIESLSALQLFQHDKTKDKAWEYLYKNDIDIESMNLSNRAAHALSRLGLTKLSALVKIYPSGIITIKNLGTKSAAEVESVVQSKLEKIKPFVKAYCVGDIQTLYSDEYIRKNIFDLFAYIGFVGLSFKEIRGEFPEDIDDSRIKKMIGELIRDNILEYVDFRCYRVYPSYFEVLERDYEQYGNRETDYILRRYNDETLESIAKSEGLTRERIRQICAKKEKAIKHSYTAETGLKVFDEDYYAYFYSTYETSKEFFCDFLKLQAVVFNYLKNTYSKGHESLSGALNDSKLDLGLKIRIRDYLNRNKIEIDGVLLDKKRQDVEEFILEHYCQDELTYDAFVALYNDVLRKNNVSDKKLLLIDEVARSRVNRLSDSKKCLWKQGERLRYYDIDAGDYDELMETINLGEYSDIDISTLKFVEDYPETMEKYDIHDEYELHNLLKKIAGKDLPNDMSFSRQPVITFGHSNRVELYQRILNAVSPVTAEEFAEYIHMENGFNKQTILLSPEIQQLSQYYHNGVYSIDFKHFPDEHAQKLSTLLGEDFYYIDEILKIYKCNFDDADLECINPRSLKSIGFNIFSKYAIRNYSTAESYFRNLLTKDDVFNIAPYRLRYGTIAMFIQVVMDLRREYEIFLFENDQYINYRRLSKAGVSKQIIEDFCNEVKSFVRPNTYFTMRSLRDDGFSHELEDLGFDDIFYAGILAVSPFFCFQKVYGNIVLYSGNDNKLFSIKAFIRNLLEEYDAIDIDDFMDDVYEKYGIKIPAKYDVTNAVSGTEMYCDSIMNKIYSNKALYYSDLDD